MRSLITTFVSLLLAACKSKQYEVTSEYAYNQNGFSQGFTIQRLIVTSYDAGGFPKTYKEDTVRVDLNYSSRGMPQKRIWFYKDNGNYLDNPVKLPPYIRCKLLPAVRS